MTKPIDHDAYIESVAAPLRPLLAHVRTRLAAALPDAEELIAYNMPGFGFGKTIIVGYAGFTKQCGIYVANEAIATHLDDIAALNLKATKTGVTFSPAKPISDDLITKLALASRASLGV